MPRLLRILLLVLIVLALVSVLIGLAAGTTGLVEKAALVVLLALLVWAAFRLRRGAV